MDFHYKTSRVIILSVVVFASAVLVGAALEDGSRLLDGTGCEDQGDHDVVVWTATIKGTNTTGGLQWKKKVNGDFIYDVIGTKKQLITFPPTTRKRLDLQGIRWGITSG
jgi:hypothetical protein